MGNRSESANLSGAALEARGGPSLLGSRFGTSNGKQTVFGARLRQWAANPPAPVAMIAPGRKLSFDDLCGQVEACAAWLVSEGVGSADTIAITIADEFTHLVVALSLLHLGVPQFCLPSYDPPAGRADLARRLAAARIVVTDARDALTGIAVSRLDTGGLTAYRGQRCEALVSDPDAPALIFTSSGTTGAPKIVVLSQDTFARRAERRGFTADDRVLVLTTVEDYPAKCARIYAAYLGLTSVFQAAPPLAAIATGALCAGFRVSRLDVGALQAEDVARESANGEPLPEAVNVFVGGSRLPGRVRAAFADTGRRRVFGEYGTRETGLIASAWLDDRDPAQATVGAPCPWIEAQIVDAGGGALPPEETGELRVRCDDMIREYRGDPVASARHFRDGWFYPGDIGSLTVKGSLCIHGRTDDMMNLNGIKIFPAEIERVLEEHSAVKAAAAFAIPSAVHGDIPAAAVELRDAATASAPELLAWARQRLGVRAPRRIIVLAALPRNATGKIVKRELIAALGTGR